MTDLIIRQDQQLDIPTGTEPATAQLVQWAQAAVAASQFAEAVCNTQAVPQAYRGRPAEAAAAILAGAEVGLSPMASLRAFDNIQGTPAPKAMTLRSIAQGLGHDVHVEKSTPTEAIVSGLRRGDPESKRQHSTWTIERAAQMGLTGKAQWKQQPAAMLVARATSEVCRWIASDAIMGMPYSAEEIRDQGSDFTDRPAPRRITAADILGPTEVEPAPQPAHPRDLGDAPEDQPITDDHRRWIMELLNDHGHRGVTEKREAVIAIIRRPIDRLDELTMAEAVRVIGELEPPEAKAWEAQQ